VTRDLSITADRRSAIEFLGRARTRERARAAAAKRLLYLSILWMLGQAPLRASQAPTFGQDACPSAEPAYIRAANETGGIPMFLLRSEAAKSFHLVRESTRNNVSTVFWATGDLDGKMQTMEIPVDSVTQRITFTFSVNTKGGKLVLKQPSGGVTTQGSASTEITDLNCGRIVTVASPQPGNWRAEISGTGTFWLEVQAQSNIYFVAAQFVKEGGRPGHQGLFRIQGQPLAGRPATLDASLSAPATRAVEFQLVNARGAPIEAVQMRAVNSDRRLPEFVGSLDLPTVPFRVAVMGRDSQGWQYQRFFPPLFHSESVEVSPELDFDELPPAGTKQAIFRVHNTGAPRTFRITVADARHFVTNVEPKELSLDADESGIVHVDLMVPAETPSGVGDDVVVVAAATGEAPTSNSCVVHLSVQSATSGQPPP
jgi:hypothetical protein